MYAISRHQKKATKPVRTIALDNPALIALWWTGKATEDQDSQVLQLLADLKHREMWIACSCAVNATTKTHPLLSIVDTPSGSLSLRRMTKRIQHTNACVFRFDKREPKASQISVELQGWPEPVAPPDFVEDERPSRAPNPPGLDLVDEARARVNVGERADPLSRQLHWLLFKGEIQHWPLRGKSSAVMLLQASADVPAQKGLEIQSLLYCNARAWEDAWMEKSFATCKAAGKLPQAILICPVYSASRENGWVTFEPDGSRVNIHGRMAVYGDDDVAARFPMLMYAKVTAGPNGVNFDKAYLHPVLNGLRHWMLVDSHYEREAMAAIITACEALERKGIECQIHKPIHDWGNTGARPDFVVTGRNKERQHIVIVETMGTDDPEYTDRKRGTVAKLAPFTVFADKRYIADGMVDDRLIRFLIGNMTANLLSD
ncbi:MAG: hypothetical protein V4713_18900 [Pseudomonadota bacterium]